MKLLIPIVLLAILSSNAFSEVESSRWYKSGSNWCLAEGFRKLCLPPDADVDSIDSDGVRFELVHSEGMVFLIFWHDKSKAFSGSIGKDSRVALVERYEIQGHEASTIRVGVSTVLEVAIGKSSMITLAGEEPEALNEIADALVRQWND